MGKIQILDEHMTNLIAAGEVIERAKSVVKELVENSIDANATRISIQLLNAGLTEIRVSDNGTGMDVQDAKMCFIPHATSKIRNQNDLFNIATLGFRGEALASIVAVSSFNLKTSVNGYQGIMLSLKGGVPLSEATISFPKGTEITVRNLFFNTPARLQHLSSPNVELAYITDFVSKIAIAHSEISFVLTNNGKELIHTYGNNNVLEVISSIYSTSIGREMLEIFDNDGMFKISGYISKISVTKSSKNNIIICLNGRVVYNKGIVNAILEGYGNLIMPGKYPIAIINIDVDLGMVDVNVHPSKYEVRLSDESNLKAMITNIVHKTLSNVDLSVNVEIESNDIGISNFEEDANDELNVQEANVLDKVDSFTNEVEDFKTSNNESIDSIDNAVSNDDIDVNQALSNLDKISFEEDSDIQKYLPFEQDSTITNNDLENNDIEEENINEFDINDFKEEAIEEDVNNEKNVQTEFAFLDNQDLIDTNSNRFQKMYYVGQLFGTYIIAQNEDTFFLIDQHAANERVNYEKIKKEFAKENVATYELLVPFRLEFSPSEKLLIEENMPVIQKFGIGMDEFGTNTYVVRSIPIWFFRGCEQEMAEEIIMNIIRAPKGQDYSKTDFLDHVAATMACKKSIKGNEYHSSLEIEYLLEELAKCENPFTCPHGRPVIVKISRSDVEKWFKRIVS